MRLRMEEIVGSLLPSYTQPNDKKEMWNWQVNLSIQLCNIEKENIIENPILHIRSFLVATLDRTICLDLSWIEVCRTFVLCKHNIADLLTRTQKSDFEIQLLIQISGHWKISIIVTGCRHKNIQPDDNIFNVSVW